MSTNGHKTTSPNKKITFEINESDWNDVNNAWFSIVKSLNKQDQMLQHIETMNNIIFDNKSKSLEIDYEMKLNHMTSQEMTDIINEIEVDQVTTTNNISTNINNTNNDTTASFKLSKSQKVFLDESVKCKYCILYIFDCNLGYTVNKT